jgi:hypothetical protein
VKKISYEIVYEKLNYKIDKNKIIQFQAIAFYQTVFNQEKGIKK